MSAQLKEKFSSRFENIDDKTIYFILGAFLVAVFLLDYFVLMRPQLATLTKINPELKILSEDISKARTDITKLNQYQQEVAKLEVSIKSENEKIEPKDDVPLILEHISRIANENDVKISQIMPNQYDSEIILENNERLYHSLPIEIEAKAGYHDFGRFISKIESGKIFLKVKKMTIAAIGGTKKHSVKLTVDAIVYEEIY